MKKITKMMLLMICSTMVLTMASCLNDDDDSTGTVLSPQEAAEFLRKMHGTAYGKTLILYYAKNASGGDSLAVDSVMTTTVAVNASDSTARMTFPMNLIAHNIKDNQELKTALEKMGEQILTAKIIPYRVDNQDRMLGFYFIPEDGMTTQAKYSNGEEHRIELTFANGLNIDYHTYSCIGGYSPSSSLFSFYIIPYSIVLDGKTIIQLRSSLMMFDGEKSF